MPATMLVQTNYLPLEIHFPALVPMTLEQFDEFCKANPNLRIERTAQGNVYRPHQPVETLDNPETVSGEPVLPGFVLRMTKIW